MLNICGQIGRQVGYEVSIEGFGDLDVMWRWNQAKSNVSFIELSLEHESHGSPRPAKLRRDILPEVRKLTHFKSRRKMIMYYPNREDIKWHLEEIEDLALASPLHQDPSEEWLVLALSDFRIWIDDSTRAGHITWNPHADASIWNLDDKSKALRSRRLKANFASDDS